MIKSNQLVWAPNYLMRHIQDSHMHVLYMVEEGEPPRETKWGWQAVQLVGLLRFISTVGRMEDEQVYLWIWVNQKNGPSSPWFINLKFYCHFNLSSVCLFCFFFLFFEIQFNDEWWLYDSAKLGFMRNHEMTIV